MQRILGFLSCGLWLVAFHVSNAAASPDNAYGFEACGLQQFEVAVEAINSHYFSGNLSLSQRDEKLLELTQVSLEKARGGQVSDEYNLKLLYIMDNSAMRALNTFGRRLVIKLAYNQPLSDIERRQLNEVTPGSDAYRKYIHFLKRQLQILGANGITLDESGWSFAWDARIWKKDREADQRLAKAFAYFFTDPIHPERSLVRQLDQNQATMIQFRQEGRETYYFLPQPRRSHSNWRVVSESVWKKHVSDKIFIERPEDNSLVSVPEFDRLLQQRLENADDLVSPGPFDTAKEYHTLDAVLATRLQQIVDGLADWGVDEKTLSTLSQRIAEVDAYIASKKQKASRDTKLTLIAMPVAVVAIAAIVITAPVSLPMAASTALVCSGIGAGVALGRATIDSVQKDNGFFVEAHRQFYETFSYSVIFTPLIMVAPWAFSAAGTGAARITGNTRIGNMVTQTTSTATWGGFCLAAAYGGWQNIINVTKIDRQLEQIWHPHHIQQLRHQRSHEILDAVTKSLIAFALGRSLWKQLSGVRKDIPAMTRQEFDQAMGQTRPPTGPPSTAATPKWHNPNWSPAVSYSAKVATGRSTGLVEPANGLNGGPSNGVQYGPQGNTATASKQTAPLQAKPLPTNTLQPALQAKPTLVAATPLLAIQLSSDEDDDPTLAPTDAREQERQRQLRQQYRQYCERYLWFNLLFASFENWQIAGNPDPIELFLFSQLNNPEHWESFVQELSKDENSRDHLRIQRLAEAIVAAWTETTIDETPTADSQVVDGNVSGAAVPLPQHLTLEEKARRWIDPGDWQEANLNFPEHEWLQYIEPSGTAEFADWINFQEAVDLVRGLATLPLAPEAKSLTLHHLLLISQMVLEGKAGDLDAARHIIRHFKPVHVWCSTTQITAAFEPGSKNIANPDGLDLRAEGFCPATASGEFSESDCNPNFAIWLSSGDLYTSDDADIIQSAFETLREHLLPAPQALAADEAEAYWMVYSLVDPKEIEDQLERILAWYRGEVRRIVREHTFGSDGYVRDVTVLATKMNRYVDLTHFPIDGSGRTSRLVSDYVFLQFGLPPPLPVIYHWPPLEDPRATDSTSNPVAFSTYMPLEKAVEMAEQGLVAYAGTYLGEASRATYLAHLQAPPTSVDEQPGDPLQQLWQLGIVYPSGATRVPRQLARARNNNPLAQFTRWLEARNQLLTERSITGIPAAPTDIEEAATADENDAIVALDLMIAITVRDLPNLARNLMHMVQVDDEEERTRRRDQFLGRLQPPFGEQDYDDGRIAFAIQLFLQETELRVLPAFYSFLIHLPELYAQEALVRAYNDRTAGDAAERLPELIDFLASLKIVRTIGRRDAGESAMSTQDRSQDNPGTATTSLLPETPYRLHCGSHQWFPLLFANLPSWQAAGSPSPDEVTRYVQIQSPIIWAAFIDAWGEYDSAALGLFSADIRKLWSRRMTATETESAAMAADGTIADMAQTRLEWLQQTYGDALVSRLRADLNDKPEKLALVTHALGETMIEPVLQHVYAKLKQSHLRLSNTVPQALFVHTLWYAELYRRSKRYSEKALSDILEKPDLSLELRHQPYVAEVEDEDGLVDAPYQTRVTVVLRDKDGDETELEHTHLDFFIRNTLAFILLRGSRQSIPWRPFISPYGDRYTTSLSLLEGIVEPVNGF